MQRNTTQPFPDEPVGEGPEMFFIGDDSIAEGNMTLGCRRENGEAELQSDFNGNQCKQTNRAKKSESLGHEDLETKINIHCFCIETDQTNHVQAV